MRLDYSPGAESFRDEVRAFLHKNLPGGWRGIGMLEGDEFDAFIRDWRRTLFDARMLAPSWPQEYGGRGLSHEMQVVMAEEFAAAGVPCGGANDEAGIAMLGNTLLELGSTDQKSFFLPRILSGESVWCQGYSEPNAGSDLANISTRAVLTGEHWVIDGEKTWTSGALDANWIFIIARTDRSERRHRGLSFLLVPLEQPGVMVRPIEMINGQSGFCETFFTGATTAAEHVVGEVGDGWRVGMHLLGHERGQAAVALPIRFQAELARLIDLATECGAIDDPIIRQRLAWCAERVHVMRLLGLRDVTSWIAGKPQGAESSVFKLHWSEYHGAATQLAVDILGPRAMIAAGRRPQGDAEATDEIGAVNSTASWQGVSLNALSETIYAGTSEIQRSIIGERILGLPREPRAER